MGLAVHSVGDEIGHEISRAATEQAHARRPLVFAGISAECRDGGYLRACSVCAGCSRRPALFSRLSARRISCRVIRGMARGGVVALLSLPLVWWAFMPPHFEFGPLTHADYEAMKVFILCSALLAMLSDLGQQMLAAEIDPTEGPDT